MRFTSVIGASVLAASAQASLVSIQVPVGVRKGEEFTAQLHVQSGQGSGEVAYIWGELPNKPNSQDDEMGHVLLVTPAQALPLGVNQIRVPGIQSFADGESTLKVRVETYEGVGGIMNHFNCQANIKLADRTSNEVVALDCKR